MCVSVFLLNKSATFLYLSSAIADCVFLSLSLDGITFGVNVLLRDNALRTSGPLLPPS